MNPEALGQCRSRASGANTARCTGRAGSDRSRTATGHRARASTGAPHCADEPTARLDLWDHRVDGANEARRGGRKGGSVSGPEKVLLVGSNGGHLTQLLALEAWWRERDRTWVTFDTEDARSKLRGERVHWAYHPTTRNIPNLLRNFVLAFSVLRRTRPDVVVSTGAGVALPFFVLAWLRRIPTVYLEVYDRLDTATLTGRLCRPFTTLFCVQWEEQ